MVTPGVWTIRAKLEAKGQGGKAWPEEPPETSSQGVASARGRSGLFP